MVALYWFLSLVMDGRPRYWVYLGITLGIGLEVKYTIVGLIAGVLGATGVAAVASQIAWILFIIGIILLVIHLATGRRGPVV